MTAPLFLADPELLAQARPGGTVQLTGPEARHAVSVQRLRLGEDVLLADGRGRRVRGRVTATSAKDQLTLGIEEVADETAPGLHTVLVQALAKGGRDEQAVETAVEVGVDAITPWRAQRCVSVWEGAKREKGRAKWQSTCEAAAKQSRRAFLPQVAQVVTSSELARWTASVTATGGVVLVLHESATLPLSGATVPRPDAARPPTVAVVAGPEGGIAEEELAQLRAQGAQVVRLGPHVLRTSTAGPLALAVLLQRAGMWE